MSIEKLRNIGLDKLVTQVYDFDSLTTDELMCKFTQKINIIIEHFKYLDDRCYNADKEMELKLQYLLNEGLEEQVAKELIKKINDGTIGKIINETVFSNIKNELEDINNILIDYVNVEEFGAKLDGVTDDSLALTNALKVGNVSIPPGKKVFIGDTVKIDNPQRIIKGNESTFIIKENVVAFKIGDKAITESLLNINIKDMFVIMNENSSFVVSYNSYFIKYENIRIHMLQGDGFGFKVVNGFNITFNECHITGKNSGVDNISGNNAKGIVVETSTDVADSVIGTSNITNILIDSCLIQKCEYGIYFNNLGSTVYDTNKINNIGFSYCDNAIFTNSSKIYNLQIKLIRAEYCGVLFTNNGNVTVEDVYCYHTNYCLLNGSDGYLIFNGMLYHWNDKQGWFIKNNDGVLSLKGLTYFERTGATVYPCEGELGRILQRTSPYKDSYINNSNTSLYVDPFTIHTYNQQTYLDFNNITGNEGSEFFILSTNDSNFLLTNGTYQTNDMLGDMVLHCRIIDGKAKILNEKAVINKLSNVSGITGTGKQCISIVEVTGNLSQFNFYNIGLTIIYSKTSGVTLSNGNNNILNFGELNNNDPVDLYNKPLLMIPCFDDTGKGFAIKC